MLEVLCGSKNIQKILIFLLINGKCYGTQLHKLLKSSLTPIQKALSRLERAGIIMSDYEGKTRLYQFNPTFPLLEELELLLKKAYTLLPAYEKGDYYIAKEERAIDQEKKNQIVMELWQRLLLVKRLTFHARSKSKEEGGWNGKGKGEVSIAKEGNTVLIFTEKGIWEGSQGKEIVFSNVFRWTLDRTTAMISLEHLRRGADNPVFLFHLAPSSNRSLSSIDSHLCEGDAYFGRIFLDRQVLRLNWRVIGPKKNEEIDYYYS